jgi:hypothetical protein
MKGQKEYIDAVREVNEAEASKRHLVIQGQGIDCSIPLPGKVYLVIRNKSVAFMVDYHEIVELHAVPVSVITVKGKKLYNKKAEFEFSDGTIARYIAYLPKEA